MVKGVNKSVIEISNTGNKFFNKVILFIAPEYSTKSDKILNNEAEQLIKRLQLNSGESLRNAIRRQRKRRRYMFFGGTFGVIAAIISVFVFWL